MLEGKLFGAEDRWNTQLGAWAIGARTQVVLGFFYKITSSQNNGDMLIDVGLDWEKLMATAVLCRSSGSRFT